MEPFVSILVNGVSKGFSKSSRGLRQGDPLSPFLFSLMEDGLSAMLKKTEERTLLTGCIFGDDRILVSYLQFANYTILVFKADRDNISKMMICMQIFQAISGLKVNMFKSYMVSINVTGNSISSLTEVLGCNVGT